MRFKWFWRPTANCDQTLSSKSMLLKAADSRKALAVSRLRLVRVVHQSQDVSCPGIKRLRWSTLLVALQIPQPSSSKALSLLKSLHEHSGTIVWQVRVAMKGIH